MSQKATNDGTTIVGGQNKEDSMKNTQKLNNEVTGVTDQHNQRLEDMLRMYLPMINRITLSFWYKLRDETVFQRKCIDNLERMLTYFDPSKGKFDSLAKKTITRTKVRLLNDRKHPWDKFKPIDSGIREEDDVGAVEEIWIKDDLAVVDDSIIVNERIALLAEGDSRKRVILKAWSEGYFNDSELATLLAQRFGGVEESHRKFIRRFRNNCREKLQQTA